MNTHLPPDDQSFVPTLAMRPGGEFPGSVQVEADDVRALRRLCLAEKKWQRRAAHVRVAAWLALAVFIAGIIASRMVPRPTTYTPSIDIDLLIWLAIAASVISIPIAAYAAGRARDSYFKMADVPFFKVPLVRLTVGEQVGRFNVAQSDRDGISLMPRVSDGVVHASKIIAVPLLVGCCVILALILGKVASSGSDVRTSFLIIKLILVGSLLGWWASSTSSGAWSLSRQGAGAQFTIRCDLVSLRHIRSREVSLSGATFEIDRKNVLLLATNAEPERLMPLPRGPLGRWHAARVVSAIQRLIDPHQERVPTTRILASQVPLGAWPVGDQRDLVMDPP